MDMHARFMVLLLVGGLVACVAPQAAAQGETARAIIGRALQTHGGEAVLARLPASQSQSRGTIYLKRELTFREEVVYQLPDKYRETKDGESDGQRFMLTTVFNGEQGWFKDNGRVRDLTEKELTEVKEEIHLQRVRRLSILLENPYELTLAGETRVHERPAVGVKVSVKGQRDLTLYFDKEKALLVKIERRTQSKLTGEPATEERVFSDYREVNGVPSPRRTEVFVDGKKLVDVETLQVKFLDKLDPTIFLKP
jgi:hypothetical protein